MKKFYLFMLMAVGLLISTSMWATPDRPVPPEPKAPEGMEMPKTESLAKTAFGLSLPNNEQLRPELKKQISVENLEQTMIPDGFFTKRSMSNNAKAPRRVAMSGNQAKIGTEEYATLELALQNAQDGDVITLLTNINPESTVIIDKDITLDLGDFYIDAGETDYTVVGEEVVVYYFNDEDYNGCVVSIQADVTITSNGSEDSYISAPYYGYSPKAGEGGSFYELIAIVVKSGSLILENTTVQAEYVAINNTSNTSLTIDGGLIEAATYTLNGESSDITINSGTVSGYQNAIYAEKCNIYVNGGKITTYTGMDGSYTYALLNTGYTEINGGTINAVGKYAVGIESTPYEGSTSKLKITKGEISGAYFGIFASGGPQTISIEGGTIRGQEAFYASSYYCSLDISGGSLYSHVENPGKTTISGGRVAGKIYAKWYDSGDDYHATLTGGVFDYTEGYKYNASNQWVSQSFIDPTRYHFVEVQLPDEGNKKAYRVEKGESIVAQILGGEGYSNLADALLNVQEEGEIQLLMDVAGCNFDIDKPNITIDLNGKTITNNALRSKSNLMTNCYVFGVYADNVTIKNGTIDDPNYYYYYGSGSYDWDYSIGIFVKAKDATLQNLTVTGNPGYSVYISTKDGEYSAHFVDGVSYTKGTVDALYKSSNSTYTIRGTYANTNIPANEGWNYQPNDAETYTLVTCVAKIEGRNDIFSTVEEAIAAADPEDVILIKKNLTGVDVVDIVCNKNLTIYTGLFSIDGKLIADNAKVKVRGNGYIKEFEERNGGDIDIFRCSSTADPANFKAEGCKVTYDAGTERYTVIPQVAELNGTKYYSVTAAFAALRGNSTPEKVTLLEDDYMDYEGDDKGSYVTLTKNHDVTLDLNGYSIYGASSNNEHHGNQMFSNSGTFTVMDSKGTGSIYALSTNVEDYVALGLPFPSYAYNIFLNRGTLIIEGGHFYNQTRAGAAYVIDNYNGHVIINGGTLVGENNSAIRTVNFGGQFSDCDIIINGGEIISEKYYAIWVHLAGADTESSPTFNVTVNGGTISGGDNVGIFVYSYGNNTKNVTVTYNDGRMNGRIDVGGKDTFKNNSNDNGPTVLVTGGTIDSPYGINAAEGKDENISVIGGTFYSYDDENNKDNSYNEETKKYNYVYDYFLKYVQNPPYCDKPFESEGKKWIEIASCNETIINESTTITDSDQFDSSDVIKVDGNDDTDNPVIVTIGDDEETPVVVNVNKMTCDGEGQIIVKKGAVLEIGAGGIKTNNHEIQPIIVEAGGTLRVGVGGVSKEAGTLNPVEIYNDGTNSGAFMINPNAQVNTMPEATITLTTNVHKGYWQHLALPIENLTEHSNDKGAANAVFEWKNNDWNQLGGWNEIKAFKGYDFTNNYEGDGKVTYTFKGQLVGIQNQGLTLIEGVNFFGNSYTAPISLSALFDQIGSDMAANTIEKTVYIYNSSTLSYGFTSQLGIELAEMGYTDLDFKTIAPLQGFWMNLQEGKGTAGTTINYAKAVWNNTEELGKPQFAPSRKSSSNSNFSAVATIKVTATNGAADKVILVEGDQFSAEFENGSDASKMMSEESFNLFATTANGKQSMVATDNLEGTTLTFQAGQEVEYTMTFANVLNNDYSLLDLLTNEVISMTEGNSYTFMAVPNSTEARFQIIATAKAPTAIENTKSVNATKMLKNGMLYIKQGENIYNAQGQNVK